MFKNQTRGKMVAKLRENLDVQIGIPNESNLLLQRVLLDKSI